MSSGAWGAPLPPQLPRAAFCLLLGGTGVPAAPGGCPVVGPSSHGPGRLLWSPPGFRPGCPGPQRDRATHCGQGSEKRWDLPPMCFWAFLSDAPRGHPEGHQEGGVGTDRFPHGRAVASFGLTSRGTQPRMGAGGPGALVHVSFHPEQLGSGPFPLGPSPQVAMVLTSKRFPPAASSMPANRAGWGRSCEAGA